MTSPNGLDLLLTADALPPELLAGVRAEVLATERTSIIREREILIVRFRVQQRIKAPQTTLDDIAKALENCELALLELEQIAREWADK